jgi:hypothetical protein
VARQPAQCAVPQWRRQLKAGPACNRRLSHAHRWGGLFSRLTSVKAQSSGRPCGCLP